MSQPPRDEPAPMTDPSEPVGPAPGGGWQPSDQGAGNRYGHGPGNGSSGVPGYGPGPGPAYGPGPHPGAPGRGLAVAALVVGAVALLAGWVPFVNVIGIVLGIVAAALGVVSLVLARRGRAVAGGLAWTGASLGAAAVVVALVVDVLVGVSIARSSRDDASGPVDPAPSATAAPAQPSDPSPSGAAPSDGSARALALGQSAAVGDYTVAVTAVDLDADDELAQADEFNEPPSGQYVLVDLAVVYTGTEEGDPWIDLGAEYLGADARNYSSSSCSAAVLRSGFDVPTLRAGGAGEYQVCFDVPAEAVADGVIGVTSAFDFTGEIPEQYWTTGPGGATADTGGAGSTA